jgi:hypothetical protein
VNLTVRLFALVLLSGLLSGLSCSAPPARPRGPAPVYERPAGAPWDAGSRVTGDDPFAAAAESEWIGGSEDGGADADAKSETQKSETQKNQNQKNQNQKSDQPASDSLDAGGASTLH